MPAIFPIPPQNTPVFVKNRDGASYMHRSWVQYFQNLAAFFTDFVPSVDNPTVGNFAALDEDGNIVDSGVDETSFAPRQHNHQNADQGGKIDHGLGLTGLTDDDHPQYLLLSGRGGQSITDDISVSGVVSVGSSVAALAGFSALGESGLTQEITLASYSKIRTAGGIIVEVLP